MSHYIKFDKSSLRNSAVSSKTHTYDLRHHDKTLERLEMDDHSVGSSEHRSRGLVEGGSS